MNRVLAILEDTVIDAEYVEGKFVASFTDTCTGGTEIRTLSAVEFGVTMALALGAAEEDPRLISLYEHVEHIDFTPECRPYP